jgi:hypothetical protein
MDVTFSTSGKLRNAYYLEHLMNRHYLRGLGIDGKIILKDYS